MTEVVEQAEHDRGEGDEQVDRQLHELERIARAMPLREERLGEIARRRGAEEQRKEKEGRPEIGHGVGSLGFHAVCSSDSAPRPACHATATLRGGASRVFARSNERGSGCGLREDWPWRRSA